MTRKHLKYNTVTYHTWQRIKGRCYNKNNPSYKNYGLKGITVCERWKSFEAFLEDMGERPPDKTSLDRIDSNKGYYKENCRWADWIEQENNTSRNRFITYKGITLTKAQWARRLGKAPDTIAWRLKNWGLEKTYG